MKSLDLILKLHQSTMIYQSERHLFTLLLKILGQVQLDVYTGELQPNIYKRYFFYLYLFIFVLCVYVGVASVPVSVGHAASQRVRQSRR